MLMVDVRPKYSRPRNVHLKLTSAIYLSFFVVGFQFTLWSSEMSRHHRLLDDSGRSIVPSITVPQLNASQLFLNPTKLRSLDPYAAAWWMKRERFQLVDVSTILSLEEGSFVPMMPLKEHGEKDSPIRMTRDWLDFSVEHLSTRHKLIGTRGAYALAEKTCLQYVKNRTGTDGSIQLLDKYMDSTLVIIPSGVPDDTDEPTRQLLVAYLAATISSLIQHGAKRIVVVGHFAMDAELAMRTFEILLGTKIEASTISRDVLRRREFVHQQTELSFVRVETVKTSWEEANVPFGALLALQKELLKKPDEVISNVTGSFLGTSHSALDFSFIFFTEPDQVLHARITPVFLHEMHNGGVIVPHRLQPIPHSQEVTSISDLRKGKPFFPGVEDHAPVISLHHSLETDACCDTTEYFGQRVCENFWWVCGYGSGNFSNLERFDLMRLIHGGTGFVMLAGNEHGRMCRVQLRGRGSCRAETD